MKASIVITNYNYARFLPECIESCLNQTHQDIEIIVVNDGSTDDSKSVIESYAQQHSNIIGVFQSNMGHTVAMNSGVAKSSGDVIFFLDADDYYRPNYISEALKVYEGHRECDFLTCALREFGDHEEELLEPFKQRVTDMGYTRIITYLEQLFIGGRTSTNSITSKAATLVFPIQHAENYRTFADFPLTTGSSLAGCRKFFLNEVFVEYRVHGNNIWRTFQYTADRRYLDELEYRLMFARHSLADPTLPMLAEKPLRKLLLAELLSGTKHPNVVKRYAEAIMHHKQDRLLKRYWTAIQLRIRPEGFLKNFEKRWLN